MYCLRKLFLFQDHKDFLLWFLLNPFCFFLLCLSMHSVLKAKVLYLQLQMRKVNWGTELLISSRKQEKNLNFRLLPSLSTNTALSTGLMKSSLIFQNKIDLSLPWPSISDTTHHQIYFVTIVDTIYICTCCLPCWIVSSCDQWPLHFSSLWDSQS